MSSVSKKDKEIIDRVSTEVAIQLLGELSNDSKWALSESIYRFHNYEGYINEVYLAHINKKKDAIIKKIKSKVEVMLEEQRIPESLYKKPYIKVRDKYGVLQMVQVTYDVYRELLIANNTVDKVFDLDYVEYVSNNIRYIMRERGLMG